MAYPAYYAYRGKPNVFSQPSSRFSSTDRPRCLGFDEDGEQCYQTVFGGGGGCCPRHKGQSHWLGQFSPSLEERIEHARNGRCCGIAASTGWLCNRKISGCTFCHSHRDQAPPAIFHQQMNNYYEHSGTLELTTTSARLKDKLMEYCWMRSQWSEQQRKQREDAEGRARRRADEANAARERLYREHAEQMRREAEEADRRRREAEAEAERLRQEQERQRRNEEGRERRRKQREEERYKREYQRQRKAEENERAKAAKKSLQYAGIIADFWKACDDFDKKRFWPSFLMSSLSFRSIPWPVLLPPAEITPDSITWDAVEQFFEEVRRSSSSLRYKEMVETARKVYHPNRWAARRVCASVPSAERECVTTAGNTVSQAVNSIATSTL